MGQRGETLRDQILWTAKDVFLELGFERTSMDAVAARAGTTKRTLYAHFESKEKLFFAVMDLAETLFSAELNSPRRFSEKPAEALTAFCARYLEMLTYGGWVRMCRICMAESERFPAPAQRLYALLFTQVQGALATYLHEELGLAPAASTMESEHLLAQTLYPRFQRVHFAVDAPAENIDARNLRPDLDVKPIRSAVENLLARVT